MAATLNKEQRAEFERQAWFLRQRCWTQDRIAEELGVSQQAVSHALRRVERRLHREFIKTAERVKARQTANLEYLLDEATRAWHRSKEDAQTVKTVEDTTEINGVEATTTKTETTVKGQAGDAALLAQARGALADIRGIWGLDAPAKQDITSGGRPMPSFVAARVVERPAHEREDDDGDDGATA